MVKQTIRVVRGMRDMYGREMLLYNLIVNVVRDISRSYGYSELQTPIIEYADVFHRTLGESSDIVNKETYTFDDRDGSVITMRPEFTASVVRALITGDFRQNHQYKFFSHGPLFRHERPQKGRYRQFHQFNCEFVGANGYHSDVEVILLADRIISALNLQSEVSLEINTLGDKESMDRYKEELRAYFNDHVDLLSNRSRELIALNPLRIFDSKKVGDASIASNAPQVFDYFNEFSKEYYHNVLSSLDKYGIKYKENNRLVRGMDYYRHTVFEFKTRSLGAQDGVISGGRYDGLVEQMGGDSVKAIGFAGGIERVMELMMMHKVEEDEDIAEDGVIICVLPIAESDNDFALEIASQLRDMKELVVFLDYCISLKKGMRRANERCADYVIVVGEQEARDEQLIVRNMESGEEQKVAKDRLGDYFIRQDQE